MAEINIRNVTKTYGKTTIMEVVVQIMRSKTRRVRNPESGELEDKPYKIAFDMDFNGKDKALSEYLITETDGVTTVTWFLGGERGFGGQLMNALFKFDKMMAKNFADGLDSLKKLIEAQG